MQSRGQGGPSARAPFCPPELAASSHVQHRIARRGLGQERPVIPAVLPRARGRVATLRHRAGGVELAGHEPVEDIADVTTGDEVGRHREGVREVSDILAAVVVPRV